MDATAMTKAEYDAYVDEHGHAPDAEPRPGEKHRAERNLSNVRHVHHSRGI
jgi:hypothetical protein